MSGQPRNFLDARLEQLRTEGHIAQHGRSEMSGGGGDGGDNVEARVKRLEDDMLIVKTDLAVIKQTMATKEDLHRELRAVSEQFNATVRDQTKTFVGWMLGIASIIVIASGAVAWIGNVMMKH